MVRRWFGYAIMMLILGIMAIIYSERMLSVLFLFGLLLPFFSLGLLLYSVHGARIYLDGQNQTVKKGEELIFSVWAVFVSRLACGKLVVSMEAERVYEGRREVQKIRGDVFGRGEKKFSLCFNTNRCGAIRMRVKKAHFTDLMGLFRVRIPLPEAQCTFLVSPDMVFMENNPAMFNPNVEAENEIYSDKKPGDDPAEIFGVREFRPGDKKSRVHWKLSAKMDEMIIKELGLPLDCSVCIPVDVCTKGKRGEGDIYEAILETALSLSATLLNAGQMHYIAWLDGDNKAVRRIRIENEEDLYEAIGGLLQARNYPKESGIIPAYLAEYVREQPSNLFYVSKELLPEHKEMLSREKANSYMAFFKVCPGRSKKTEESKTENDVVREALLGGVAEYMVHAGSVQSDLQKIDRILG